MITKIINGRIIADNKIEQKSLYIKDGLILDITEQDMPADEIIDAEGSYVSAGFIDIHCHGGGGYDFMDGEDALIEAAKTHFKHGTTAIFPTTVACSPDALKIALADIKSAMQKALKTKDIPHICGVHLEGPYFALSQAGAQNPKYITPPVTKDYIEITELFGDIIKRWSFAPELPGTAEFCEYLIKNNIIPAIAHSDAVYDDVAKIYDIGCKLVTHLYSATSTVTRKNAYRQLGVIESAYLIDDMAVEVIADGHHLPAGLLQLIYKIKGADNICLVTDAMRGAGMPEGDSFIGAKGEGLACIIEDGVAKLPDRSAFAGSVATADRLIKTMLNAGINIADAVKMLTETPARVMNISNKGSLKKGYDADIIIFDDNINIKKVIKKH
jgi:N-acetylglucosamine-6-phosphate deacetylase